MEFRGTKGDWELIIPPYERTNGFVNIENEDGLITCYNGVTKGGAHPKALANALLISKAPEMLEMLKYCVKAFEQLGMKEPIGVTELIKEATEI
jgi:hypothetical protein